LATGSSGAAFFAIGMAINLHSDAVLFRLRRPGESGYRIPQGGLYRLVSSPNYLGEIVEWLGWAIATWSLAGLAFAVYTAATAANLVPRAIVHHRWYRDTFADYPVERKAIIPFRF
jgi:3-oxo-5-alpha-steroid 4-dehydrogenase 1